MAADSDNDRRLHVSVNPADFYLLTNHVSRNTPRAGGAGRPWYTSRTKPIQLGVIHTAENLPDFVGVDDGAEAVARYGATTERASWHDTIDSDSWIRMLPHSYTAFHVMGYNSRAVGVELATQAARWVETPDGWRHAILDGCAAWVADVHRRHGLPIRQVTKAQADAGMTGFTGHGVLDPTRRTDPGAAFPWDYVLDEAAKIVGTPPPPPGYADRADWPAWAVTGIEEMIERGIMRGDDIDGQKRFHANRTVTRAELAVALWRMINTNGGT